MGGCGPLVFLVDWEEEFGKLKEPTAGDARAKDAFTEAGSGLPPHYVLKTIKLLEQALYSILINPDIQFFSQCNL